MSKVWKSTVSVFLTILILSQTGLADVIYLKDGKILRGKIVEETETTIKIEGEDYWKEINREDVERIKREAITPAEKPIVIEKPEKKTTAGEVAVYMVAGVGLFFLVLILLGLLAGAGA